METIKWIECLVHFVAVAESKSISLAAKNLGLSKSQVSKTIKLLEDEIGEVLFLRSTRVIKLTSFGEQFLNECRSSLEKLQEVKSKVKEKGRTPRGLLRVTTAGIFGENFIAPVLLELSTRYPELQIEIHFDAKVIDLIEEKFDVGIRIGSLTSSSLYAQKIATRREFVCASKGYLKKMGTPQHPQELKSHNCLGSHWKFRVDKKNKEWPVSGNIKTNNPRVLLRAALEGIGIIKLPGSYVFEHITSGELIPLLENFSEGKSDIWVVTPYRVNRNINVSTFIEALKNYLSSDYPDVLF